MAANSSRFLLTWFGTAVGGQVEVPINTAYEGDFLEHQVRDVGARWAVIDDVLRGAVRRRRRRGRTVIERFWVIDTGSSTTALRRAARRRLGRRAVGRAARAPAPVASSPTSGRRTSASIFFTSGTTGPSKGVAMPHAQMYFFAEECVSLTRLTDDDTYMSLTPLFHGNAQFLAAYPALIAGARFVLPAEVQRQPLDRPAPREPASPSRTSSA